MCIMIKRITIQIIFVSLFATFLSVGDDSKRRRTISTTGTVTTSPPPTPSSIVCITSDGRAIGRPYSNQKDCAKFCAGLCVSDITQKTPVFSKSEIDSVCSDIGSDCKAFPSTCNCGPGCVPHIENGVMKCACVRLIGVDSDIRATCDGSQVPYLSRDAQKLPSNRYSMKTSRYYDWGCDPEEQRCPSSRCSSNCLSNSTLECRQNPRRREIKWCCDSPKAIYDAVADRKFSVFFEVRACSSSSSQGLYGTSGYGCRKEVSGVIDYMRSCEAGQTTLSCESPCQKVTDRCMKDCNGDGSFTDASDLQVVSSCTQTPCKACSTGYTLQSDNTCKQDCNGDGDFDDPEDATHPNTCCASSYTLANGVCKKDCNGDGDVRDTCDLAVSAENPSPSCVACPAGYFRAVGECDCKKDCDGDGTGDVVYPSKCSCANKDAKACNASMQCVWDCNNDGNFNNDIEYSGSAAMTSSCSPACNCPSDYSVKNGSCKKDCNGDGDVDDAVDVMYPARCACADPSQKQCHNNQCVLLCNGVAGDLDDVLSTGCFQGQGDSCNVSESSCHTINDCNPIQLEMSSCSPDTDTPANKTACEGKRTRALNKRYTISRCFTLLNQKFSVKEGKSVSNATRCVMANGGTPVDCNTHYIKGVCPCPVDAIVGLDSSGVCKKDCNKDRIFDNKDPASTNCPSSCRGSSKTFVDGICWQDCDNNGVFNEKGVDQAGATGCQCISSGKTAYDEQGICKFDCNDNGSLTDPIDRVTSGCACGAKIEQETQVIDASCNQQTTRVRKEVMHCPQSEKICKGGVSCPSGQVSQNPTGALYDKVTDTHGLSCCQMRDDSGNLQFGCANPGTRSDWFCLIERAYADTDNDGEKDPTEVYVGDIQGIWVHTTRNLSFASSQTVDELWATAPVQSSRRKKRFSCSNAGSVTPVSKIDFQCYYSGVALPDEVSQKLGHAESVYFQDGSSTHPTEKARQCDGAFSASDDCSSDHQRCLLAVSYEDANNNSQWDASESATSMNWRVQQAVRRDSVSGVSAWNTLRKGTLSVPASWIRNQGIDLTNTCIAGTQVNTKVVTQSVLTGRNQNCICKKDCNMDGDFDDAVDTDPTNPLVCNTVSCVNGGTHDRNGVCKKDCNSNGSFDDVVDVHESLSCCSHTDAYRTCTNVGCGCDRKGSCSKTCLNRDGDTVEVAEGATCYKECSDGSFVPTTGTCSVTCSGWNCCSAPPCTQPWDINIFTTYPDPI